MPNSVNVYLPKKLRCEIKEVIVTEINGLINVREAMIDDYKTLKVKKDGHFTYSSENAKEFIGAWNIEVDGDYFIFNNRI